MRQIAGTPPVKAGCTVVVLSALIIALMSEAGAGCLTVPAADLSVGFESSVVAAVFAAVVVADLAVVVALCCKEAI